MSQGPAPVNRRVPRKQPSQQRSRERVDRILRAAGELLATEGFESLSTNAIAARAGLPIGSLYQYFEDKDQIIDELVRRFSAEISEFAARELRADDLRNDTAGFIRTLIGGIGRIQADYAGFVCLFAPGAGRDRIAASADELKRIIVERLDAIFAAALPELAAPERRRILDVWLDITRGMISSLDKSSPSNRAALIGELQIVLLSYLRTKLNRTASPSQGESG
jgi:AcrR family transcriptional regulator